MSRYGVLSAVGLAWLLGTCGCEADDSDGTEPPAELPTYFGGEERPVELHVPDSYDPAVAAPLLILLHGFTASGLLQSLYLGLRQPALERGMLYAFPDGTVNDDGDRFWNATDACCDFYGSGVDDSGYLIGLVAEIRQHYSVDPQRIYFAGHSNGGFMSYRMACDHAATIAAVASLAGSTFLDPNDCHATEPVHVLQIHGTADDSVLYEGSEDYPGAVQTVEHWAGRAGCELAPDTSAGPLDLEEGIAGAETEVARYDSGCDPAGSAELWTITGGGHLPAFSPTFAPALLDFLLAHPKP